MKYLLYIEVDGYFRRDISDITFFGTFNECYNYGLNFYQHYSNRIINDKRITKSKKIIWKTKNKIPRYTCKYKKINQEKMKDILLLFNPIQDKYIIRKIFKLMKDKSIF